MVGIVTFSVNNINIIKSVALIMLLVALSKSFLKIFMRGAILRTTIPLPQNVKLNFALSPMNNGIATPRPVVAMIKTSIGFCGKV